MTIVLNSHMETSREMVHGDKELYWLAMSISGDESYAFNKAFAGSIGEIATRNRSHYPTNDALKEICSNQPAHIYTGPITEKKELLWMNTGFKYCKKIINSDKSNPIFAEMTPDEIREYSAPPLKIKVVIIPPSASSIDIYGISPTSNW